MFNSDFGYIGGYLTLSIDELDVYVQMINHLET